MHDATRHFSRPRQSFGRLVRHFGVAFGCVLISGFAGCSCHKTDEEILKERLDTTKVHLYLATKIAILKSDEPEAKKVKVAFAKIMAAIQPPAPVASGSASAGPAPTAPVPAMSGSAESPPAAPPPKAMASAAPELTGGDILTLLGALYTYQAEGKELLRSGNEKDMRPVLPYLFSPNPRLNTVFDLNQEHAFLLTGLFAAKFHPKMKIPIPDEIALYEAWMTDASTLQLTALAPIVRGMKSILYANNELCDLAGKEGQGAEKDADKLTGPSLSTAFSTIKGDSSEVQDRTAKVFLASVRALTHGAAGYCYKKRDRGDDEKKFIDELDGFLKAADDMGIRSSETVYIRAYVSIQRGQRDEAKKHLEAVRDNPNVSAENKAEVDKLIEHLNDDGFINSYFDNVFFVKSTTLIVFQRLDEAGAFDSIKEADLVKTVNGFLGATGQTLGEAKQSISTDSIKEKLKGLTDKK